MNSLSERAQGAHRHSSSGWWRALLTSVIAGALLLTGLGMLASPASATVAYAGASAAAWPTTWKQYTYQDGTRISDVNGDQTPTGLDLVSGTCAPAPCTGSQSSVAYASDGTNAFFRMRMAVDNNDNTKGGLFQGAFLVQIADASGVVKAVVGVDGKDAKNDMVYVADAPGNAVPVYVYPFTAGSPSSAGMRWIPANDGTGQYFLDFQVPLSALSAVSSGAVTATSKIKLYYGSSAANNLATLNKDLMLGDVTSADFTNVKLIQFMPTVYAVSFDSQGGSAVASQNIDDGDPAVQPANPTRSGYFFDGWFTAASGGTQWDFSTAITAPKALYAHWTASRTVSFDSDGGSPVASQVVRDGSVATAPADPTRAGHDFQGWFSGANPFTFSTPVTGDLALTAHWARHVYTVSFDTDGGTTVDDQHVAYQDLVTEPAPPTRAGHDFQGWFLGASAYEFTTPVDGAITLTAHWTTQVYTVSFDSDGGSAVTDQPVAYGDSAVAPSDPTRAGYDFAGWYSGDDAYDFADPVTGPLSLTAHWAKHVYTVSFDSNGGSAVDDQSVADQDLAEEPTAPTRTGYDFAGWFVDGDEYDFATPVTGALALTAHWAKQVYTVSFDANGGSAVDDQSVAYQDLAEEPTAPTRTGYDFAGWFVDGDEYDFATPVTGGLSLTAHWAKQVYTVSFDANGGSDVADQSVAYGDAAELPEQPTREGYDFAGWFSGEDAYDFGSLVTGPLSVTAHWTKQVFTVSFDSDGGSEVDAQLVTYGDSAVAPSDPTRTGYDFAGWYSGDDAYTFTTAVTGPTALTAHWSKHVYTVSFDSDGGSQVDDQPVVFGDSAVAPSDPTRSGYDFAGWYSGDDAYDFATPVTGPLTLTASWAKQVYTVSFDADGGSVVDDQSVAFQDPASEPTAPTRTGYDFAGWFLDGDEYDFATPVTGGLMLTAHWTKQVYTVSFDSDGGSAVADQPVAFGDSAAAPSDPTRTGYDFAGWFSGSDEYDFASVVTGPLSLTAHWTKHVYTVSFDANGGSAVAGQPVAYQDLAAEPTAPTRAGYVFQGWFLGGTAYDFATPVTGGITLTAHWAKEVYTVTFDANGGSAVAGQPVAYSDLAAEPTAPTRTGYVFQGWFLGGTAYDFATPVTGGITLTAHWAKQVYPVSFDAKGGSAVAGQSVAYLDHASKPADPTRVGYAFQGWFLGGSAYDFATPVTGAVALTAQWTVADSDGDGVTDLDELAGTNAYHCATDPRATDTDHDGLTDAQELRGIKMRVKVVTKKKTFRIGLVKTNPCRADTDRDGLKDGREVRGSKAKHTHLRYKSNPLAKDSDRDHLSDKVEVTGKANKLHGHRGSNPLNWDTDHGGVSDLGEIRAGSDPTSFSSGPVNPRTVAPGLW